MVLLPRAVDRVSVAPALDAEQALVVDAAQAASRLVAAVPSAVAPYAVEEPDAFLVRAAQPALDASAEPAPGAVAPEPGAQLAEPVPDAVAPEPDAALVELGLDAVVLEQAALPAELARDAVVLEQAAALVELVPDVVAPARDARPAEQAPDAVAPEQAARPAEAAPDAVALALAAAPAGLALAAVVVQEPDVLAEPESPDVLACSAAASG